MARPDLRSAATVRLKAERSRGLSANVLRLLNGEVAQRPTPDAHSPGDATAAQGQQNVADAPQDAAVSPVPHPVLDPVQDAEPGFVSSRAWSAAIRSEERRYSRYREPVTLMVVEVHGLQWVVAKLGRDAADFVAQSVGESIRRMTRASDVVSRHGSTRFMVLMPQTDEVAAINCVERLRAECDALLDDDAPIPRLALGWAQAGGGGGVADALKLAEARMEADRHRRDA